MKRIYSYLSRAAEYYDPKKPDSCGTISYLLWGGKSMLNWTESKLKGLEASATIIDGRAAYSTIEEAEKQLKILVVMVITLTILKVKLGICLVKNII